MISVRRFQPKAAQEWDDFAAASNNGTLFHSRKFLAYHPPGRFEDHSLMLYQDRKLVGLLPASPQGKGILTSPYGASVGGLVLPPGAGAALVLESVESLQAYASKAGFGGIEMRIGPNVYLVRPDDALPFALAARGFKASHSWMTFIVGLDGFAAGFSKSKRYDIKANLQRGLRPRECGAEGLEAFWRLLEDTCSRHDATPTHSKGELETLLSLGPKSVRLFLCAHEGRDIVGVLLFVLNKTVAYTFYICEESGSKGFCGPAVLLDHVFETLAREGFAYADLGPSASDAHFNAGVVFFKEGLGAKGFLRQTWTWTRP